MNEFEFLDMNDYELVSTDICEDKTIIEFEDDNFYILKYLWLSNMPNEFILNGIKVTIEELYRLLFEEGNKVDRLQNGTEVVLSEKTEYLTPTINGNRKIKNVSRHKVSKNRWEILIKDKEPLYITEDHSIIVYRDGELIECKPNEILETDCLIVCNGVEC